jgi:hypothetical protein
MTGGVVRRFAARFALVAFGWYHVPQFLNDFPSLGGGGMGEDGIAVKWGHIFTRPFIWIAEHVFHLAANTPEAQLGDNGDTAAEYCRLLVGVVVAMIAASAWTFADRRSPRAPWVDEALRVLLRYAIVLGLAGYAIAKIVPLQFGHSRPEWLESRVGETSPMGILWRMMETSRAYSLFGGVMELVAIALLSFRRTATLGALACIAVMTNVAMMNLCYGVPVKLYSMMVTVSAAVLVAYDARRLADLLVFHRATAAAPPAPPFRSARLNDARWIVKLLLIGGVLLSSVYEMRKFVAKVDRARTSELYGTWRVESFVKDGRELARTGEASVWRRWTLSDFSAMARLEDESRMWCQPQADDAARTLKLDCKRGTIKAELRWTRDGDALRLEGTFDGAPLVVALKRIDDSKMPLLNGSFHWIGDGD